MKIKIIIGILFVFSITSSYAQITIDGHEPFYDEGTQSLLFITDSLYAEDLTASIDTITGNKWDNIKIDGEEIVRDFYFGDVTADKIFLLTATEEGKQISRTIHFTTLPVIHIIKEGAFTRVYEQASIRYESLDTSFVTNCYIKIRGASSSGAHKKSYKFKIADEDWYTKDISLQGMRKSPSWILDAGAIDLFRLRNSILHNLWVDFSTKPYYFDKEPEAVNGCHTKVAEVFVNNEYRGFYSLMEPLDREQLKLKEYSTTQGGVRGLLYKASSWEGTTFWSNINVPYDNSNVRWSGWEMKYPAPQKDADTTDYKPLSDFINIVVSSSNDDFKSNIGNIIDVPVFRDYILFVNLENGIDDTGKNMYWSIYNKTDINGCKLVPSPWDMDATFGQYWTDSPVYVDSVVISPTSDRGYLNNLGYRLASTFGQEFVNEINSHYASLRRTYFSYNSLISRFTKAYNLISYSGAANRETMKWSRNSDLAGNELDFGKQLEYIKNWTAARLRFLDNKYGYSDPAGIETIRVNSNPKTSLDNNLYNLNGQRVPGFYYGIVIRKGHKYIQK